MERETLIWRGRSAQVSFEELHTIVYRLVMERRALEVRDCITRIVTRRCREVVEEVYAPFRTLPSSDTFRQVPLPCFLPFVSIMDMVSLSRLNCMVDLRALLREERVHLSRRLHVATTRFATYLELIASVCMSYDEYYAKKYLADVSMRVECHLATLQDHALLRCGPRIEPSNYGGGHAPRR
jgi:hypothetical protein